LLQATYSGRARLYTYAGLRSGAREALFEESEGTVRAKRREQLSLDSPADRINAVFRNAVKQKR
jgi:hypothetical protein